MKKIVYLLLAFVISTTIKAQFITTNPASTPVTLGSDLNMAVGKVIKFNNLPVIKSFGTGNASVGENAGNTGHTGIQNTFVGIISGNLSTIGDYNTFVGGASGRSSTGSFNASLGANSLANNIGGNYNTAAGYDAGRNNTGTSNLMMGTSAGFGNTGNSNVFLGTSSGTVNTGTGNVFAGFQSGINNTSGLGNLYLGAYAGSASPSRQRGTAIGYQSKVEQDDAVILGQWDNLSVKIGIGTAAPTDKLHVNGTVRFQGLPTDAPGGTAVQYLVADATGKVYLYTGTAPARLGVDENNISVAGSPIGSSFNENWTLKNDYLINKNKRGIIIGQGITSMPLGYGMYVSDGILTEKVKVAIKNSNDWADYVFNKDYKKLTLTEVEKYINTNKHLPNIPSAAEMAIEGNDLHKTDVKLLEKIEELTLYMIEMKKENAQMKRQINSLKRKIK
ncbi:MAG: TMF family protein [Bacteroidota bacterium]